MAAHRSNADTITNGEHPSMMESITNKVHRMIRDSGDESVVIPGALRAIADKYHIPAIFLWVPNRDGTLSLDPKCAVVTDPAYTDLVVSCASRVCALGHDVPGKVALTGEVVAGTYEGMRSVGFPVPFPGEGVGCVHALLGPIQDGATGDFDDVPITLRKAFAGLSLALGPLFTLREARAALRRTSRRLHAITSDSDALAVILRRDGVIVDATGGDILGNPQTLRGCNIEDFMVPSDYLYLMGAIETQPLGEPRNLTFKVRRRQQERTVDAVLRDLRHDPDVNAYVLNLRDTTEQRSASRALVMDTRHDFLTGLLNQNTFSRTLDAALRQGTDPSDVTVLIADINDFKKINDSLGHIVADDLLRAVAARLTNALPRDVLLSRIDGDSFGIVLIDDEVPVTERLRNVEDVFAAEFPSDTGGIRLDVTIGAASPLPDAVGVTAETLIWQADLARFHARRLGTPLAVFTTAMQESVRRQRRLESDLAQAAQDGDLRVDFQPLIHLGSGRLVGIEALVRWEHAEYGLIPPGEFVPIAEHSGNTSIITEYVLREATAALRRLDAAFGERRVEYVAVNISAPELVSNGFVAGIKDVLESQGLTGDRLALEITESVFVADPERATERMQELSSFGVRLDIDDFGTGYSSLTYLTRLPAHALKIDKSFVDSVLVDARTAITVAAIIGLGHQLGLRVVAEGVEDEGQAAWLREHGVDSAQGYVFSPPLSLTQLEARIQSDDADASDLSE